MKFLLVGHAGSFNRGCEAIVRTTIALIHKEFGQSEITISSFDYENEKLIDFGPNVQIIPAKKPWDRWTWPWLGRQIYKLFSKTYRNNYWRVAYSPVISAIEKSDIVLSIGGDNYTMDYGFPEYFFNLNKLVKEKEKKLILWAASIGPFPENEKLEKIVDNLRSVDLITVRETESFNYLTRLGIITNVKRVADPAFLLPLEAVSLEEIWSNTSKGILGINISYILGSYIKEGSNDEIITEIILFLRKVIKKMKLYIWLIPHITKEGSIDNDYTFMGKIYEELKNTKMINRISPRYNAMQVKYLISKCRFFIGARTHSTIAALSTSVPTLCIGYSVKAKGINKDIFGGFDFLLNINNLSAERLFEKFTKMVIRESEIRQLLFEKIPMIKKMSWENIKYIKEIL